MRRLHIVLVVLLVVLASLSGQLLWGDAAADSILWGTLGDDQIIWGTLAEDGEYLVWGT